MSADSSSPTPPSNMPITPAPGTHLVVGAGEVGSAVALVLADAGADVVLASRSGGGPTDARITRVRADASNLESLFGVAPTSDVVYNCVNPAYTKWVKEWPPMARSFIDYAERTGAVLATVSNLYGYGPVDGPMTEDLPLDATGDKARVRARMWEDAKSANDSGRIRATEVRGSDYICPGTQSLLGDRVMPRILAGKNVQLLGDIDQPHSWTAPTDVARLLVTAASDQCGWGRAWHVPSNPPRSAREAVADLATAAGVNGVKASSVSPAVLWSLGLFQPAIRELKETDYQRDRPYILDDSAARATFGLAPTPWTNVLSGMVDSYRTSASAHR